MTLRLTLPQRRRQRSVGQSMSERENIVSKHMAMSTYIHICINKKTTYFMGTANDTAVVVLFVWKKA